MKTMRNVVGWMFGAAALLSTAAVQAGGGLSYPGTLLGTPGGQVTATWTFDAGVDYPFTGANFWMEYDPASMDLVAGGAKVEAGGTEYDLWDVLDDLSTMGAGVLTNVSPGMVAFSVYLPVSPVPVVIPVSGPVTLSATFELSNTFTGPALIRFGGALAGEADESLFDGSIQVTTVPEPETWLMWLGGLGLLALGRIRRQV